jgi:glycosyltransferase involved in cell wall biosynthesis
VIMNPSMAVMPSISALVPVYNEIAIVSESVREIHDFMQSLGCTFEILIIESGSSDGTAEACDKLASQFSEVVVFHEGQRNGFGAALRLGFAKAASDLIWVVPVDLPYSLSFLQAGLRQIADCDAVLSVRRSDDRSLYRRLQSRIYSWLCSLLLRQPGYSPNAAFKLYRRSVVLDLPLRSNGWFIDTEIACRLRQWNCRLGTVAIDTVERTSGQSTVTTLDSWQMFKQLLAFRKVLIDENKNR